MAEDFEVYLARSIRHNTLNEIVDRIKDLALRQVIDGDENDSPALRIHRTEYTVPSIGTAFYKAGIRDAIQLLHNEVEMASRDAMVLHSDLAKIGSRVYSINMRDVIDDIRKEYKKIMEADLEEDDDDDDMLY